MAKKKDGPKCTGRTASGRPCANAPLPGRVRCYHHSYRVPGRPTKLTPELVDRVVDAVRLGMYFEQAAAVVGIDKTTLYRWLKRGEQAVLDAAARLEENTDDLAEVIGVPYDALDPADWPYVDFRHALESAAAIAELELLEYVRTGRGAWQAAMTVLERRWPSRWGRFDRLKHEGAVELARPRTVVPEGSKRDAVLDLLDRHVTRPKVP